MVACPYSNTHKSESEVDTSEIHETDIELLERINRGYGFIISNMTKKQLEPDNGGKSMYSIERKITCTADGVKPRSFSDFEKSDGAKFFLWKDNISSI